MAQQMNSKHPVDNELLESIGITVVGHRLRLLTKLNSDDPMPDTLNKPGNPRPPPEPDNQHSLEAWFTAIKLKQYALIFLRAGFDDMTQLLEVHKGDFRITNAILSENIAIDKIGHALKIIIKLDDEVARMPEGRKNQMTTAIEKTDLLEVCKKCVIM